VRAGRERGGAALLLAFMILVLMAGAGLATSRNLMRELAMVGDARLGERAAAAADSGLEWFLAWAAEGWAGEDRLFPAGPTEALFPDAQGEAGRQSFELRVRNLGPWPPDGDASAPPGDRLCRVTSIGRCRVGGRTFIQVRELLAAIAPGSAGPGPGEGGSPMPRGPRILAWRSAPLPPPRRGWIP
jgi:hypothetical protein